MQLRERLKLALQQLWILGVSYWHSLTRRFRKPILLAYISGANGMALIYSVAASAPVDKDVAKRTLTVSRNGQADPAKDFSADTTNFGEVSADRGEVVRLSLVDTDTSGNGSVEAVFEFTARDTTPPAQPGGLGVALVREE